MKKTEGKKEGNVEIKEESRKRRPKITKEGNKNEEGKGENTKMGKEENERRDEIGDKGAGH
jgi:hypothetical protein